MCATEDQMVVMDLELLINFTKKKRGSVVNARPSDSTDFPLQTVETGSDIKDNKIIKKQRQ